MTGDSVMNLPIPVADLGFPEGGFCYNIKFKSHAHFRLKNHAHFDNSRATTTGTSPTDRFLNEFSAEAC